MAPLDVSQAARAAFGHAVGMSYEVLIVVLFVGAAVAIAYLLRQALRERNRGALDILRERFARGEIDLAEFEERRRTILG